uniref:B30.2/SPRY domain-containing protein n=1 Tax=Globodera rostochiensis TaxID=31243 RepID=A0A914GY83_GLORO
MEEYQKQQQHNIDESAKMEEYQKQQQHNIDESAEMEQLNMDYLKSDQKQISAPIDQGTSQLMEEYPKQQQQNIDALTDLEIVGKIENLVTILARACQWRRYDPYRIAGAIVLFIFIIYTALQLNEQNEKLNEMRLEMAEMAESLKSVQAMVGAEMENGNFAMAAFEEEEQTKLEELKLLREKIKRFELELTGMKQIDPFRIAGAIVLFIFVLYTVHRFSNKIAELEGHQNQQQQNIDALTEAQKRNGLIPQQNRWNSSMCHKDLKLSEPDPLIVQNNGNWAVSSVLAVEPISKEFFGISYFEVKIEKKDGDSDIQIGLANKEMPLDKRIQEHAGAYGYDSCGRFWGHEVAGCSHGNNGRPYIYGKPSFGVGDVIGCGVNLATRQIFYTLNGQRLETGGLFVTFAADLFPCVTLPCDQQLNSSDSGVPSSTSNAISNEVDNCLDQSVLSMAEKAENLRGCSLRIGRIAPI